MTAMARSGSSTIKVSVIVTSLALLAWIGAGFLCGLPSKEPWHARVHITASHNGIVAITMETDKVALLTKGVTRLLPLNSPDSKMEYTYIALSEDGRRVAITERSEATARIIVHDIAHGKTAVVPKSRSDIVVKWLSKDMLLIRRAESYNAPDRFMGPIYERLSYLELDTLSGSTTPYFGTYASVEFPERFMDDGRLSVVTDTRSRQVTINRDGSEMCLLENVHLEQFWRVKEGIVALNRMGSSKVEITEIDERDCSLRTLYSNADLRRIAAILDR